MRISDWSSDVCSRSRFIKFSCFVEIWNLEREMIDRMYAEAAHSSFKHSLIGHDPLLDDSHAIRNQVPNRESCNLSQCAAKLPYRKAGAAILQIIPPQSDCAKCRGLRFQLHRHRHPS